MRSDRDIQRVPRRPLARASTDSPVTDATPAASTTPTPAGAPGPVVTVRSPEQPGHGTQGPGERFRPEPQGGDQRRPPRANAGAGPSQAHHRSDHRPDSRPDKRTDPRPPPRREPGEERWANAPRPDRPRPEGDFQRPNSDPRRGGYAQPAYPSRGPQRERSFERPFERPGERPIERSTERRAPPSPPAARDIQARPDPRPVAARWPADRPQRPDGPGERLERPQRPADHAPWRGQDRPRFEGRPADPRADLRPAERAPARWENRQDQRRADGQHPAAPRPAPASEHHPDGIRLSKLLAERNMASRREADDWIAAGWVRVNGQMAVLGQRVRPQDRIDIDPAAQKEQARRVTILLNKPIGYVSGQAEDGYEPASVLVTPERHWTDDPTRKPFHPGHARGLAPAGRLDIDSTGLLVLTQDGRIAKLLIGEDSEVEKEYLVRVENTRPEPLSEADLRLLNHGLHLDGQALRPAKVSWANEDQLRFVLREGRKRQIRRMCELVGLKVVGLKRVRIGSVVLGKLPPGQWRYLRDDERF